MLSILAVVIHVKNGDLNPDSDPSQEVSPPPAPYTRHNLLAGTNEWHMTSSYHSTPGIAAWGQAGRQAQVGSKGCKYYVWDFPQTPQKYCQCLALEAGYLQCWTCLVKCVLIEHTMVHYVPLFWLSPPLFATNLTFPGSVRTILLKHTVAKKR